MLPPVANDEARHTQPARFELPLFSFSLAIPLRLCGEKVWSMRNSLGEPDGFGDLDGFHPAIGQQTEDAGPHRAEIVLRVERPAVLAGQRRIERRAEADADTAVRVGGNGRTRVADARAKSAQRIAEKQLKFHFP